MNSIKSQKGGQAIAGGDKLDLIPFLIDYHVLAEISKDFLTRTVLTNEASSSSTTDNKPAEAGEQLECYEGSFRGRYLHGTQDPRWLVRLSTLILRCPPGCSIT
ncbi:uncharacterized protein PGTG_16566 [Puccinia graminis f. sp. tritici CRL 75-36-700-3]|uniref:Uncharacterized protein n=1 Tax=Puccinia graminis f. sp. tritici (strain CRL 75-36-700-3 / race SCCL) TaxID=418459 RepID=E3L1W5_PUCGT|nr:uncharacterized protein PGTG_16566 [Puccinia graminis f. sp. tritici CRL 75-36-700-3]EFP90540.1 hypothetical protein PGTG_16566 [Puccinia graminis f. sp. tritici CRL 75-36-700-3]